MTAMPYTHWAYFDTEEAACKCGDELTARFDILCTVDPPNEPDEYFPWPGTKWLLRGARNVDLDTDWHAPVETVVVAHGGKYDGGEATYSLHTGEPIRAADS